MNQLGTGSENESQREAKEGPWGLRGEKATFCERKTRVSVVWRARAHPYIAVILQRRAPQIQ